ncbi:MAG: cobalamin adenosyltransferase [Elusimicrobiota bacterium]|jgi:ethanolamine utilization cobalamin adenosyltransferase|nr:cobalamin adenosyltransferase [Elusimicrobiota bacterium]
MRPLTEQDIRRMLKNDDSIKQIAIPKNTILTPSALEYLVTKTIDIEYRDDIEEPYWKTEEIKRPIFKSDGQKASKNAFYGPDGEVLDHKPETMTHFHGNHLVYKDHPVIIWRGKLDDIAAAIVEAQAIGAKKGNGNFVNDLQEILDFVRHLLPCEYREIPLGEFQLLNLSSEDIREHSHDVLKYYGRKHILIDCRIGDLSIALNNLRVKVREAELAAAAAFKDENGKPSREDIIEALNRLSSIFYILMYKYLPKNIEFKSAGI